VVVLVSLTHVERLGSLSCIMADSKPFSGRLRGRQVLCRICVRMAGAWRRCPFSAIGVGLLGAGLRQPETLTRIVFGSYV
jgi:hypothetical protein